MCQSHGLTFSLFLLLRMTFSGYTAKQLDLTTDDQLFSCSYFCSESGTKWPLPPKFEQPCIPQDVQSVYRTPPGSTNAVVKWTEPTATDSNGDRPSIEQAKGERNGGYFKGTVRGYQHTIVYLATDRNGFTDSCSFNFTVVVPSCRTLGVAFIQHFACTNGTAVGSSCSFTCETGFRLSGSGNVTCKYSSKAKQNPDWDNVPRCERVRCGYPSRPDNADLVCTDNDYSFQSVCRVECKQGFIPVGPHYVLCQKDGQWTGTTVCTRQQSDYEQCPSSTCNGHKCVQYKNNTFTCECSHGWSGRTCEIPPNFCEENICFYSATCNSQNSSYTCYCPEGFSGSLCQISPVDGGFSDWSLWTECSVTCGSGVKTRTRSCNNPPPNTQGKFCNGTHSENIPCEMVKCQVCPKLSNVNTSLADLECATNHRGLQTCKVKCKNSYITTPWFIKFERQRCGSETNDTWVPGKLTDPCVGPVLPKELRLDCNITYETQIPSNYYNFVKNQVTLNVNKARCIKSTRCNATVSLSSSEEEGVTATNLRLVLRRPFDGITTDTAFNINTEVISAVEEMESTADFLKTFSADTFDVSTQDVTYRVREASLVLQGHVSCMEGKVPVNGMCVECPPGTFFRSNVCDFCPKGMYQGLYGQTTCKMCIPGYTTYTVGSVYSVQCYEYRHDEDDKTDALTEASNIATIIGTVIGVLVALCSTGTVYYQVRFDGTLWRALQRHLQRN